MAKQNKKIVLETVVKQQEKLIEKLEKEKEDLEKALEDKELQIKLQYNLLEQLEEGEEE